MSAAYRPTFGEYVGPWRPAFAWFPTPLFDGHWVWLCPIEKRRVQTHDYLSGPTMTWWTYKLPGDPA